MNGVQNITGVLVVLTIAAIYMQSLGNPRSEYAAIPLVAGWFGCFLIVFAFKKCDQDSQYKFMRSQFGFLAFLIAGICSLLYSTHHLQKIFMKQVEEPLPALAWY